VLIVVVPQSTSIASWIWGHELCVFKHDACQMFGLWARSFGPFYKIKAALFHSDVVSPIVCDETRPCLIHLFFS
jgi:hypothetical protein